MPSLNGFPIDCNRLEHQQIQNLSSWFPIAALNRIDLAPIGGSHCGQQRLIFANNVGIGNGRIFMILEAQIPNPRPECGVDACRPLAEVWSELARSDAVSRSVTLSQLFLTGHPTTSSARITTFI